MTRAQQEALEFLAHTQKRAQELADRIGPKRLRRYGGDSTGILKALDGITALASEPAILKRGADIIAAEKKK